MCTITDLTAIVSETKMTVVENVVYPTLDDMLKALNTTIKALEPEQECDDFSADDIAADYASNMPCDFSGYCAGTNCPNFFKCKGSTK